MRKVCIGIVFTAFLVCAVLCTAGCVDTKTADYAVGNWFAEDDDTLSVLSIYEDSTGSYLIEKTKVSASGEVGYAEDEESTFVWAKNADGTYLISFADGEKFTAVVNTNRGILTLDDGRVFEKEPSVLNGMSDAMFPAFDVEVA